MATLAEDFITSAVRKADKPLPMADLLFIRNTGGAPITTDMIRVTVWKLIDDGTLEVTKDGKLKIRE